MAKGSPFRVRQRSPSPVQQPEQAVAGNGRPKRAHPAAKPPAAAAKGGAKGKVAAAAAQTGSKPGRNDNFPVPAPVTRKRGGGRAGPEDGDVNVAAASRRRPTSSTPPEQPAVGHPSGLHAVTDEPAGVSNAQTRQTRGQAGDRSTAAVRLGGAEDAADAETQDTGAGEAPVEAEWDPSQNDQAAMKKVLKVSLQAGCPTCSLGHAMLWGCRRQMIIYYIYIQ